MDNKVDNDKEKHDKEVFDDDFDDNEEIDINLKFGKKNLGKIKTTRRVLTFICLAISMAMLFISGWYASRYRSDEQNTEDASATETIMIVSERGKRR